ncbi:V-type ATPase subunit [Treponema sp.]|uniref:V0D/AC39 family V-type ATPase subunit n=1 Tax=Treponema sp. TaxID=166 RepID=UPI0025E4032F|nr:V-type ATPase subunit [Treponema sp.]MCR5218793.1 V-type ATPase subunit [Treponema sp.]
MAMDKTAARSYVYAKACAILSRAYVGDNARALFSAKSLSDLWSLVFKTEIPAVPQVMLTKKIQSEASARFVEELRSLLANYSSPDPLLVKFIQSFEYENFKTITGALCYGEKTLPEITDIHPFGFIKYEKWPDLKEMTSDSEISWYNTVPEAQKLHEADFALDSFYMKGLWAQVKKSSSECRSDLMKLIGRKICLDNAIWALRLKIYYHMKNEDIYPHLVYEDQSKGLKDYFVQDAVTVLSFDTDDYEQWHKWKYRDLLNPHEEGLVWTVDPRWINNSFKVRYARESRKLFHLHPFTECPLVCLYILKRQELENICTAAEGLRLNVSFEAEVKNG